MQLGFDVDGEIFVDEPADEALAGGQLAGKFLVPPFSVLNARQGSWQERKRAWISLGIQSELGRGEGLTLGDSPQVTEAGLNYDSNSNRDAKRASPVGSHMPSTSYSKDGARGTGNGTAIMSNGKSPDRTFGQDLMRGEYTVGETKCPAIPGNGKSENKNLTAWKFKTETGYQSGRELYGEENGQESVSQVSGTSIFDPVLAECAYRWFSAVGGHVLDPFSGGSVRGIVASILGRKYTGVDLRAGQIAANIKQGEHICKENAPEWICGDSTNVAELTTFSADGFDMIFSCPPYADLEVYSDDPADLSNMPYDAFVDAYTKIIAASCALLKPNRFACFVVGDVRDKQGYYRNFPGDTVNAFRSAGLELYNEAILITLVGSLPVRVTKQFESGRKLGKTHQNVLVFVKGDPKKAAQSCGSIEIKSGQKCALFC